MDTKIFIAGLVIVILVGFGWFVISGQSDKGGIMKKDGEVMMEKGADTTEKKEDVMMKKEGEMMKKEDGAMMEGKDKGVVATGGSYETYSPEKIARAESGKVVLFFRAGWCPTCKALDADIRSNLENIPDGVTILDVDYDNSTFLKQKYGVTYQHTLVQVDASGNMVNKWSGGVTLAEFLKNVK